MADPIILKVELGGADALLKTATALSQGLGQAFAAPSADVEKLNASIGDLAESIDKLGEKSQQTHEHVAKLGGGGAADALNLLKTSVQSTVEVLSGGGFSAAVGIMKELGSAVSEVAEHFGALGSAIGSTAVRFAGFAAGIGAVAIGINELGEAATNDIISVNNLATVMGKSVAQVLALKSEFSKAGVSFDELAAASRNFAIRFQESWVDVQNAVRDAAQHIISDQLAIAEAQRGVEQAQLGQREAATATADAQEKAATAGAEAQHALAEAVTASSEAAVKAREAEFDATHKLAEAQRSYEQAVLSVSDAQMKLAEAEQNAQFAGQDAANAMEEAQLGVAAALSSAASAAASLRTAELDVADAARTATEAHISARLARIQYEAKYEGRAADPMEVARLQRRQALERVRGLEAAAERADIKAEQGDSGAAAVAAARADLGVRKAEENLDKAGLALQQAGEKAANAVEQAGLALAEALEKAARAALEVELAPQKAGNIADRGRLVEEGAAQALRRAAFAASEAAQKAEDALATARINQAAAADKVTQAEMALTNARNKAVEDFANNIGNLRKMIETLRAPEGVEPSKIRPQSIYQALSSEAAGDFDKFHKLLSDLGHAGLVTANQVQAILREAGLPRGANDPRLIARYLPGGVPVTRAPTDDEGKRAASTFGPASLEAARKAEEIANANASRWRRMLDDMGSALLPLINLFKEQHPALQAVEGALAALAAAILTTKGVIAGVGAALAPLAEKLGAAAARGVAEAAPTVARVAAPVVEAVTPAAKAAAPVAEAVAPTVAKTVAPVAESAGLFGEFGALIAKAVPVLRTIGAWALPAQVIAAPALQGPTAFGGDVPTQMKAEIAADNAAREQFRSFIQSIVNMFGGGPGAKSPEAAKPPETPKPEETPKPAPSGPQPVTIVGQAGPIQVSMAADPSSSKLGEGASALAAAATSLMASVANLGAQLGGVANSLTGAAGQLSAAATALDGAASSLSASSQGHAEGGLVSGLGTGTSDSVPIMASHGEYVLKAAAVQRIGVPRLHAMNRGFAEGGLVGHYLTVGMAAGGPVTRAPANSNDEGGAGGQHSLNLVTSGGEFRVGASQDTIEAIRSSSIGAKLSSAGSRPSWY